jgi:hypothetical protein
MKNLSIFDQAGEFAENKDIARKLRLEEILPTLIANEEVVIDFERVSGTTQSFVHALISDLFRKYGNRVLDRIHFKNCNETVRKIILIVSDYMQEAGNE